MPAIKSNKCVTVLKDLFLSKGLAERGENAAANKIVKKADKAVRNSAEGEEISQAFSNARKYNDTYAGNAAEAELRNSANEDNVKKAASRYLSAGGEKATQKSYDEAYEKAQSVLKRDTAFESAKGYFTEPYKAMTDKGLSKAERGLATKQFMARTGAAVGGAALVGGIGHDMLADNEEDTGLGGIAVNTAGATGLAAGVAGGVSLLKRL